MPAISELTKFFSDLPPTDDLLIKQMLTMLKSALSSTNETNQLLATIVMLKSPFPTDPNSAMDLISKWYAHFTASGIL